MHKVENGTKKEYTNPMEINSIYNVDCVKGMDKMQKNGIFADMIIADPPYVISRDSQFNTMKDRKNPRNGIDFGEWDSNFNNNPWLTKAYRILKDGGSLLLFNDFKKQSELIKMAEKIGFVYKDTLIWHKTNPMPRNRDRRYVPDIEMILWFVKPGTWTFNRHGDKYESSILSYPSESGGGFKRIHPTQKPVKLFNHLIMTHSCEGDLILDPFMGSGTTAISCEQTGRNFIGFEIDEKYFNESVKRVEASKNEK